MTIGHTEKQKWINRVAAHLDPDHEPTDTELRRMIAAEVSVRSQGSSLTVADKTRLIAQIFDAMRGLDILQPLIESPDITEIMVNSPGEIYIERKGRLEATDLAFDSAAHLTHVISRYFGRANKLVHERSPIADMRLSDGSRVHAILPPAAPDGPVLSIRRFTGILPSMEALIQNGTIPGKEAAFMQEAVRERKNIFISGGTASGKTTFLNALAAFIPENERIVTVEDAAELELSGRHNLVRLEARASAADGGGAITLSDLIRSSLRLRPDRIIVGEVRGKEAYDMIQAMQTGHPGSMSTGHGNSVTDMLDRLSLLLMTASGLPWDACRHMVASSVNLMIHLTRLQDGSRRVAEIVRVMGFSGEHFQLETQYQINAGGRLSSAHPPALAAHLPASEIKNQRHSEPSGMHGLTCTPARACRPKRTDPRQRMRRIRIAADSGKIAATAGKDSSNRRTAGAPSEI